jgi:hypothetical protein
MKMIRIGRVLMLSSVMVLAVLTLNMARHENVVASSRLLPEEMLHATEVLTSYVYLPFITKPADPCRPTGETYGTWPTIDTSTGVISEHPDVNLAIRSYTPTIALLELVDYVGNTDPSAPQLYTLFEDERMPVMSAGYQVYKWDWNCNCRGGPIMKWDTTLLGMETTPGEIVRLPVAGYDVGGGYGALVLYAESTRLTLKYTPDDNVVDGYTLHLENICVDENLLALYEQTNAAGRTELPALFPGQPLGRAPGTEIDAAIRDSGAFLDPRSRKDWWQGR